MSDVKPAEVDGGGGGGGESTTATTTTQGVTSVLDDLGADSPSVQTEKPEKDPIAEAKELVDEKMEEDSQEEAKTDEREKEEPKENGTNGEVNEPKPKDTPKSKAKRNVKARTETPPPSKRPRRSATLPKPKADEKSKESDEPKAKKTKGATKKGGGTPARKKSSEEQEPERVKKLSSDSGESVVEEFVDADYLKGEYIAVRTDGHDFFLAEVLNDVLEKDNVESFKVQWFDVSGEDNVYVRSYEDTVDARSVVCPEVKLKKESGGRFRLKKPQLDKIKRRIKRALSGNPLSSDEDDDDVDDDRVDKAKPLKLPGAEMRTFSGKKKKKFGPRTPVGSITTGSPKPFLTPLGGLKMVQEPKKKRKSNVSQQEAYKTSPQRKSGRPPIHDTEYRPNQDGNDSVDFTPELPESMDVDQDQSVEDTDQGLKPNPAIPQCDSDPAFLASGNSYNLPTEVIAIKSIIQRDLEAFMKLTSGDSKKFNLQGFRCADMPQTVLHFALQSNDVDFVKMILSEISTKSEPMSIDQESSLMNDFILKNDSDVESGNKALIRPISWLIDWRDPDAARELASYACREGCQNEILDMLMENYPKLHGGITFRELLIERVYMAVECGHLKTAHYLIECANKTKPSPCQFTDLQRQTLVSTMDRDHPYNVSMKAAEARRKEPVNQRITAMHTAACNGNGQFLKRLLEMVPEGRNQKDERDRKPLHYAAAAYSSEPLQIILKPKRDQHYTVDEVDKFGTTPLMIAARLGRINNCKVLLDFAKKTKGMAQRHYVNRIDCHNYTALHYAAEHGHAQVIDLLKETGADVNKPLSTKNRRLSPLMLSAKQGHLKTAESLIENGAKLETKDKLGRTALMHAALNGHYPLVALLLAKGVDPNGIDNTENTALHYAAAYGWYHVVQLLLQGGASPDMVNVERISPLSVAVLKYHDDVAQLLFNHGADPNLADNQKRTLLMLLASQKPSERINERISYLVEHFSPSATVQDIHGLTVTHHLAQMELTDEAQKAIVTTAKLLINGGADLNIKDYASRTALFHAVKNANLPLIQFFLEKGAQCPESRAVDQNGENLLHLIVRMWHRGDMSHIIDQLSQPPQPLNGLNDLAGARSKAGYTPMLLACKLMAECKDEIKGQLAERGRQLLDVLVDKAKSDTGATVAKVKHAKNQLRDPKEEGRSPAHYLATSPNLELLSSLLAYTPRLDVLDSTGLTPLTSALLANQNHAACALLEAGALPNFSSSQPSKHQYNLAPLVFACSYHGKEGRNLIPAIKTMLEKIENKVNEVVPCPSTKKTALMFARDPALVKILLKKGAKVSVTDGEGRSALHHAVLAESKGPVSQVIELLLGDGANAYQADNNGQTPFHLAFSSSDQDPMELLALLTQGPIDTDLLNKGDKDGNTALHIACSVGSMASILHLHSSGASINLKNNDGNTPLSLAIKNGHEAATVLLVQLGAELNTTVCYKCSETTPKENKQYWGSGIVKDEKSKTTIERDSIEVVISHKWRNVMTLMLSRLLKRDEGMDQDYDLDRPSSGFNFARCVQAACTVPDLETALILVRRQKDAKEVNELNEHQQTLLHILAINSRSNQPELKEIAEMLIKHDVPLAAQDSKGMTALHYAVYNKCDILVQTILRAAGSKKNALTDVYDNASRTPVTALFWNSELNDSSSVRILTDLADAIGDFAGINLSTPVPLPENWSSASKMESFVNPTSTLTITPLMRSIYVNGARVIDKLLELGVDINSQVEANGNLTAIMLAVECNNLTVVRRLLESDSPPVNLSCQDNNCRTVLHHAAYAPKWGYWENTEMLKILIEGGALLNDEDVHGKTALDYALEGGNGKVAALFQELQNIKSEHRERPKAIDKALNDGCDFPAEVPDYNADADAILEKINEDENSKKPPSPEVDILSGMAEWGQIIEDLTTGLHGDVLLSEVDVKQNGEYVQNFTRMQIIGHKLKKQFVLFTRAGRCGQDGEWKITPFSIPENAIREFMKLYKIKTGNEWTALPDFRRCTKKHALVPFDLMNRIQAADLEFDLAVEEPSKLSAEVQELFKEMTNVSLLKEVVKQSIIDPTIKPFGRFVKSQLEHGLNLLFDIRDLIIAFNEAKTVNNVMDTNRMQWFLEQAMSLTFEFNKCVPNPGKRIDRILVLSSLDEIDRKIKSTRQLLKLEFANSLLLAAQYRINDDHPTDYIYRSLNCSMIPLDRTSEEAKTIVKFIENSGCESTVIQIFKTCSTRDVKALTEANIENHRLLWKPTSLCDVLYSLANGIRVPCPQSARKDPKRYRKAQDKPDEEPNAVFYEMFSDMKSLCPTYATEKKYAFLCQVALGKSKDVQTMPSNKPDGDFNSLRIIGKSGFSTAENEIVSPEGASIPLGHRTVTNQTATEPSNKYVVYDGADQMAIRYLIRFN